jgi:hypothetical protein
MRYAVERKLNSEPLDRFIKRQAASSNARLVFLGAWGEMRQSGPRGGRSGKHVSAGRAPVVWPHALIRIGLAE